MAADRRTFFVEFDCLVAWAEGDENRQSTKIVYVMVYGTYSERAEICYYHWTVENSKAQQFIINKASAGSYSARQTGRQKVIAIAKSQIGTRESNNGWTKYGAWYGNYVKSKYAFSNAAWCAMFVSWCGNQAGLSSATFYYHAYCPSGVSWYQNKKQ